MPVVPLPTNLRILKPSRKRRKPGEIFVISLRDGEYYRGRVISLDMEIVSMKNVILAYIYDTITRWKDPIPPLDKNNLLIPPFGINNLPWSRGYFETVAYRELAHDDVLKQHCFVVPGMRGYPDEFFDEYSNPLPKRIEPCGVHGLSSFRSVDDKVSKALGIPLAPD